MGDSIDNVKGVPGIGEKGARDLIATYGSLESLLERAELHLREERVASLTIGAPEPEMLRLEWHVHVRADGPRVRANRLVGDEGLRAD